MTKKENTKPRKLPSTVFSAGNEHRFAPGVSGNPSGRSAASERRLISRALHNQLAHRAPDKVAQRFNLPAGSSWAQCVSMSLIFSAIRGDIMAVREIRDAVGDVDGPALGFEPANVGSSQVVVQFVSAGSNQPQNGEPNIMVHDAIAVELPSSPASEKTGK